MMVHGFITAIQKTIPPKILTILGIGLLSVIGVYLRVEGVGGFAYNNDEWMHLQIANAPTLNEIFRLTRAYEVHPPLAQIIRHYWLYIFDINNTRAQRSLALIPGVLLIPLYYALGTEAGGRWAGWFAAGLITLGLGFIVQSFIVRDYTFSLFFSSLYFYAMLRYQREKKIAWLATAFVTGLCAISCIFVSVFTIAAIGGGQILYAFLAVENKRVQIVRILAHLLLAALALIIYFQLPELAALHEELRHVCVQEEMTKIVNKAFLFSALVLDYDLTHFYDEDTFSNRLVLIGYTIFLVVCIRALYPRYKALLYMTAILCLSASIMTLLHHYCYMGGRHEMWMAPVLIVVVATSLAKWASAVWNFPQKRPFIITGIAVCLLGLGYNSAIHHSQDKLEYTMPANVWNGLRSYLRTLTQNDIIISDKTTIFTVMGSIDQPYKYFAKDPVNDTGNVIQIPFLRSQILIPYQPLKIFDETILQDITETADQKGFLKETNDLIFINISWATPPVVYMMECEQLDKKVVILPYQVVNSDEQKPDVLEAYPVQIVILSKKAFFDELISPSGKAHGCLYADKH